MEVPGTTADPAHVPPQPGADGLRCPVRLTLGDGIRGWLQAKAKRQSLYGSGSIHSGPQEIVVQGWQRNWLGTPIQSERRIAFTAVRTAVQNGDRVYLEYGPGLRRRQRLEIQFGGTEEAARIMAQLPPGSVGGTDRSWADFRSFHERLDRVTPRAYITHALVAINILIYALLALTAKRAFVADPLLVTRWGSNAGQLTLHGEPWRLLSGAFLHWDLIHLAFNMWALWGAGRLTERLYGHWRFLLLYVLSGIVASVASIAWDPMQNSAGASGAVFGVLGALLAFLKHRDTEVPMAVVRAHWPSTVAFILYSLISGFTSSWIDNAAHIGGLLAGFVFGRTLARPLDEHARRANEPARLAGATGLCLVLVFTSFWWLGGFTDQKSTPQRFWDSHEWYVIDETKSFRTLQDMEARSSAGAISAVESSRILATDIAPFWKSAQARLEREEQPTDPALRAFGALIYQFVVVQSQWVDTTSESLKRSDEALTNKAAELLDERNDILAKIELVGLRADADTRSRLRSGKSYLRRFRALSLSSRCAGASGQLLDAADPPLDRSDGPGARAVAGCVAQRAFAARDVVSLEAMFSQYSSTLGDLPDGGSRLAGFVTGLDDYFEDRADMEEVLATLALWRHRYPESIGPKLFEAMLFSNWAWSARGHGYANSVTPQQWQLFASRQKLTAMTLRELESRAAESPLWFQFSIDLGVDKSASLEELRAIFDRGSDRFREYLPLYKSAIRGLLPRWGGSYDEIYEFINRVYYRDASSVGFELYARLYWLLAELERTQVKKIFDDTSADWGAMKHGFLDMTRRYPESKWLMNGFARFACEANDMETYKEVRPRLGNRIISTAWSEDVTVDACDKSAEFQR